MKHYKLTRAPPAAHPGPVRIELRGVLMGRAAPFQTHTPSLVSQAFPDYLSGGCAAAGSWCNPSTPGM